MSEKILFLTGKLAQRQLERILNTMKPEFSYKINQIGVNVAALMSEYNNEKITKNSRIRQNNSSRKV